MKKKVICLATTGVLALATILCISLIGGRNSKFKDPFFENKEFEAVFCSMDYLPLFSEEDFLTYRGLQVVKYPNHLESFRDVGDTLESIFAYNPKVNTIYLELNPGVLWEETVAEGENWSECMEKYLLKTIKKQKHTVFEILLPNPGMDFWLKTDENQREGYFQTYVEFVQKLADNENVLLFYAGAEPWLIRNKDNYTDTFQLNPRLEKHIYISAFCDRIFLVNENMMEDKIRELKEQIADAENTTTGYPNFESWHFVFLGDSIIGLDKGTTSVPGVVSALTGATTYNCGKGGAAAAWNEDAEICFLDLVDAIIEENTSKISEEELLHNVEAFLNADYEADKLCFLINFGLNDYFNGFPVENPHNPMDQESYVGALKIGVERLKTAWPEAEIVIMPPTYITRFNEGTDIMSDEGRPLEEYRKAAENVSGEMKVFCKNNYEDMGVNLSNAGEYLLDGCHLNDWGKFFLGEQIISFLDEEVDLEVSN